MFDRLFSSSIFAGSAARHVVGFCITSILIWATVFAVVGPFQNYLTQPETPGREFAEFLEGSYLVMLGAYMMGGFGAATRMHAEGVWIEREGGPDPSVVAFGRMTMGCVFGLLSYLALSEGLLQLFVSSVGVPDDVELKPTYVSILLFSLFSGMFANEMLRGLKARIPTPPGQPPKPDGPA